MKYTTICFYFTTDGRCTAAVCDELCVYNVYGAKYITYKSRRTVVTAPPISHDHPLIVDVARWYECYTPIAPIGRAMECTHAAWRRRGNVPTAMVVAEATRLDLMHARLRIDAPATKMPHGGRSDCAVTTQSVPDELQTRSHAMKRDKVASRVRANNQELMSGRAANCRIFFCVAWSNP